MEKIFILPHPNHPSPTLPKELKMKKHNHEEECKHIKVQYCSQCKVCYCTACGKEWCELSWTYTTIPYKNDFIQFPPVKYTADNTNTNEFCPHKVTQKFGAARLTKASASSFT